MAADDDFVFVPPRKTFLDDVEVYDAALGGIVPAWKSLIYHGAIAKQRVEAQARADAAPHTPVRDEDQPPPVVADEAAPLREEFQRTLETCNLLRALEKISQMEARIEALEKRKRANDVLLALEAAEPPEEPSQDQRTLN
jgi:hypothetical protein